MAKETKAVFSEFAMVFTLDEGFCDGPEKVQAILYEEVDNLLHEGANLDFHEETNAGYLAKIL